MKVNFDLLDGLAIGQAQTFNHLSMHPLLAKDSPKPDYSLLDDALEKNKVKIGEIDDAGAVQQLKVSNKGKKRVLMFAGDELLGAKQNRILNTTVMASGKSKTVIPVSCVESGRWGWRTKHFRSAHRYHFARGRARNIREVNRSCRERGSMQGDQRRVWNEVARRSLSMNVSSPTAASEEIYNANRTTLDDYAIHFKCMPGQVGALFDIGGKICGLDLFDNPKSLRKQFPKLLQSYAAEAIGPEATEGYSAKPEQITAFLDKVGDADFKLNPSVGEGIDIRFDDDKSLTAAGLIVDERLVHLFAFNLDEDSASRREHELDHIMRHC